MDFDKRKITIVKILDDKEITLEYDYLVFSLGSIDNYFGNYNIKKHSFTIKTLEDALAIRNHVIKMLESADNESDIELQDIYSNFVIVGGGFAGVEVASAINHLVQDASKRYYPNIDRSKLKVILISARDVILPEVGNELGRITLNSLRKDGIKVLTGTKAIDAGENFVVLGDKDKTQIKCGTLIWAGGVKVNPLVKAINCEHGPSGRLAVDEFLRVKGLDDNVYALGDCAYTIDKNTDKPYPPTAQIAIRAAKITAKNIFSQIICENDKKYHLSLSHITTRA